MIAAHLLAIKIRYVARKREPNQARCFKRSWAYPFLILLSLLPGIKSLPEKTTPADASSFGGLDLRPTPIRKLASATLISFSGHLVDTVAEPCNSSSASCSILTWPSMPGAAELSVFYFVFESDRGFIPFAVLSDLPSGPPLADQRSGGPNAHSVQTEEPTRFLQTLGNQDKAFRYKCDIRNSTGTEIHLGKATTEKW